MTREEKINTIKAIIQECKEYEWQRRETLYEIIKDLEQEPVLEKIKEVVEKWKADGIIWVSIRKIIDIVDKAENEKEK